MEMQGILRKAGGNGNPLLSKVGIGISSGVVLTGHLGSQGRREHKVIGESFKWAYTLNVMAGPGEIVVSRDVYQSIAGHGFRGTSASPRDDPTDRILGKFSPPQNRGINKIE